MRAKPTALLATLVALVPVVALADGPAVERRLDRQLDKARIAFEVDDQGDARVTYALPGPRSQLVVVRSATVRYGNLELRELVSAAFRSDTTALPADVANRLLELGARAAMGGWTRNGPMALLVVRIPADADPRELASALEFTARAADAAEVELTGGKDDY
jgi:hypothetical protein